VVSINRTLKEEAKSVTLFKALAEKQPDFAKKCFRYMDDTLVDAGELELFEKYSGDLAGYLKRKIDGHVRMIGMIRARPGSEQSIKSFEEKLVTLTMTLSDYAVKKGNTDLAARLKQMTAEVISDPRLAK
jgi:D-serine dehydratase